MQPEAFAAYLKAAVAGYAEDNVASGRWPAEGALDRSRADFDDSLPQGLATPDNFLFEIKGEREGLTVGYIWFAVVEKNGIRSAFVYDVEVRPEFRRRGHARAAFKAIEPLVRDLGLSGIGLHVFSHNPRAEALYSSLGYKITGTNMLKVLGKSGAKRNMPSTFHELDESKSAELDATLDSRESWWDSFYLDRTKPCPFFTASPCESLAEWVGAGLIPRGRALDLGCGSGRNAIFLARHGFSVEAVDYSRAAIAWARDRVAEAGVDVSLACRDVFELEPRVASYDLVYDSGCFHHLAPHRRDGYVELVVNALKPGGWFGLTCFRPEGGSGYSDAEVYERRSLGGGLGYTEERLREIWSHGLAIRLIRQMNKPSAESGLFGETFLWVLLAQKV